MPLLAAGSPARRTFALETERGPVQVALAPTLALRGHNGSVAALAADRQGKLIVSGSYDTTVQIFNVTREAVEQVRTGQNPEPTATK
mgnify:CR=1 FL=1